VRILIELADVAADAREMYGDAAREMFPNMPEYDWRFQATFLDGRVTTGSDDETHGRVTFHVGATAEHVAAHLKRDGLLPAESTKEGETP
jgi:hypothetical protein